MSEINKIKVGDITYDIEDSVARDIDINWQGEDLNNYTTEGVYNIKGNRVTGDNMPINNEGNITARLNVLVTEDNSNNVVTQVLNLNNNQGGEGNVYIRSQQNDTWKPWGKLQTNIEVGQITPDDMSNLIDNGIYSGVCVDGTTIETFVLIVINNYLAATQAGFGSYVSQLKYAIDLNRGNTVKTRTRDAYGIWNEWSSIGGGSGEVDITDAVNQYGLHTLYSQNLMKDNVVYKYQQKSGELPQFDFSDKIRQFLISKGYMSTGIAITIIIKKFNSIITLDVDMSANSSLGGDNGLNHYKFITTSLSSVKVSADMTEL